MPDGKSGAGWDILGNSGKKLASTFMVVGGEGGLLWKGRNISAGEKLVCLHSGINSLN